LRIEHNNKLYDGHISLIKPLLMFLTHFPCINQRYMDLYFHHLDTPTMF